MLKYVGKRILYMIGVFFVVSIILFVLFNNVPGDRALNQVQNLRGKVSDETFQLRYQEAREKLGLDDPIPVRYVKWMGNLLKGDLGYSSFYKKDVKDCLSTPLLNTIQINIVSTILALAITIPLGIHCAVRKFSKFDNTVQVLTIVGYSMPQYIVALVFIFVFAVKLGWFPISGMNTPNFQGTGVAFVLDRLHYLALPVITLIISWFMSIFMGSIVIEQIFQLNGIGKMYYVGLMNQDYDMALAVNMLYCIITLLSNLITDLSYGLVDPRVRIDK